jgi:hypothetical protein
VPLHAVLVCLAADGPTGGETGVLRRRAANPEVATGGVGRAACFRITGLQPWAAAEPVHRIEAGVVFRAALLDNADEGYVGGGPTADGTATLSKSRAQSVALCVEGGDTEDAAAGDAEACCAGEAAACSDAVCFGDTCDAVGGTVCVIELGRGAEGGLLPRSEYGSICKCFAAINRVTGVKRSLCSLWNLVECGGDVSGERWDGNMRAVGERERL